MSVISVREDTPGALLEITGEDAFSYLQSQFTNDLRASGNCVRYGLWLSRKGRVRADSFIVRIDPERFLVLSYHVPGAELERVIMENAVADEVESTRQERNYRLFSLWGERLSKGFGALWPGVGSFTEPMNDVRLWQGRRSMRESVEILCPVQQARRVRDWIFKLFPDAQLATAEDVEAERVQSGIPAIPRDIGAGELPQEGRLEDSAISFDKGCYLGQEAVARLQHIGQARRSLFRVTFEGEFSLSMPVPIFKGESTVGELRSLAGNRGLALLNLREIPQDQNFRLKPQGDRAILL